MHTARSASRTHEPSRSMVEYTATASTPSSWQARITRTAISPRFATRTRPNISRLRRVELEQGLTELHELRVLHQDAAHPAGVLGLELVEQLHRLEHAQRLADLDGVALLHERG